MAANSVMMGNIERAMGGYALNQLAKDAQTLKGLKSISAVYYSDEKSFYVGIWNLGLGWTKGKLNDKENKELLLRGINKVAQYVETKFQNDFKRFKLERKMSGDTTGAGANALLRDVSQGFEQLGVNIQINHKEDPQFVGDVREQLGRIDAAVQKMRREMEESSFSIPLFKRI